MNSNENLLKATLNRLSARIGQKLLDSAVELAVIAKEGPERLRDEWQLFQEEVVAEANRLDQESSEEVSDIKEESKSPQTDNTKEKIDRIRAKVSELNSKLEAKS